MKDAWSFAFNTLQISFIFHHDKHSYILLCLKTEFSLLPQFRKMHVRSFIAFENKVFFITTI